MEDFYSVLGVNKTATQEEIKLAYKKYVTELHPDKTGGDKVAEEKLKKINEAWNELKTEDRRKKYDESQSMGNQFGGGFNNSRDPFEQFHFHFGGSPFEDIFSHLRNQSRQRSANINVEFQVTLEEAFFGKTTNITVTFPNNQHQTLDVVVPAGVVDGQKIRFKNKGMTQNGYVGDLFITIRILPHQLFQRRGQHLVTIVSLNAIDAMLGTTISIKNIDGKDIQVKIPAGTQHGDTLRCSGKGFSIAGVSSRGDLFASVDIKIPKILTPEEKALLIQLKNIRTKDVSKNKSSQTR